MGMMSTPTTSLPELPEPEWEVARLFPGRGEWSEDEYLDLSTNRIVEFCSGRLEVPALPTELHQDIVAFLYRALLAFVLGGRRGKVLFAARPVRLWPEKFREPDVLFMRAENAHRRHERYWDGADL